MLLPFSYPDFVAGVHCHFQRARASGCIAQRTEEGAYPVLLFAFVTDRRRQYAEDQYKLNTTAHVSQLNRAIVAGVEAGIFVQPKVCGAPALIIYLPDLRQGPSGCLKLAPKAPRDASKEVCPDFFLRVDVSYFFQNAKPASKTASKPASKAKASPAKKMAGKPKAAAAKPAAAKAKKVRVVVFLIVASLTILAGGCW
jgi:histone H1/5